MDDDKPEKRLSLTDATTFARQLCLAHGTSYAVATRLPTPPYQPRPMANTNSVSAICLTTSAALPPAESLRRPSPS